MDLKKYVYCALDFSSLEKTLNFTQEISKEIGGVKLGLEFFLKYGIEGVQKIKQFGIPIFLDLKLNDIPNTVKKGLKAISKLNPIFTTIHISGGDEMQKISTSINKKKTIILGVTVLTSFSNSSIKKIGHTKSIKDLVIKQASLAKKAKLDGIVCSGYEVKLIKKICKGMEIITPGIRIKGDSTGDQKRVMSPKEAFNNGATAIVMGRSITKGDIKRNIKRLNKSLK